MRLVWASALTIFLLLSFTGLLVGIALYLTGSLTSTTLIAFVLVFNAVSFFLSPIIQDIILRRVYNAREASIEELPTEAKNVILSVAEEYNFKPPRIFIIPDRVPTAFTYGTFRSSARLVLTEGLLEFLEPKEVAAVVAHEMGHIVHRDFIVMTLAVTLLEIIYVIYSFFREAAEDSDSKKKSGLFIILAAVAYIFYLIGRYVVLYLSRIREYYADEFAAKRTSGKDLATALVKVSYGVSLLSSRERKLLKTTESLGIVGEASAKSGLALTSSLDPQTVGKVIAWDLHSPWAFLTELHSTHPLTGKRVLRLLKMDGIEVPVPEPDRGKLYTGFLLDVVVYLSPVVFPLSAGIYLLVTAPTLALKGMLLSLAAALFLQFIYSYPRGGAKRVTMFELVSDPYTSPVRGKFVEVEGEILGRGDPGSVFSEDFFVADGTGVVYKLRILAPHFREPALRLGASPLHRKRGHSEGLVLQGPHAVARPKGNDKGKPDGEELSTR